MTLKRPRGVTAVGANIAACSVKPLSTEGDIAMCPGVPQIAVGLLVFVGRLSNRADRWPAPEAAPRPPRVVCAAPIRAL